MRTKRATGVHVETWNRKKRVVARSESGKIITYSKYSRKVGLEKYTQIYKKNKTFDENLKRTQLSHVTEYEYRYTPTSTRKVRTRGKVQYAITARDGNQRIYARSRISEPGANKKVLREDAYAALYKRIGGDAGGYDVDKGKRVFSENNMHIESEGLIWYAPRGRQNAAAY